MDSGAWWATVYRVAKNWTHMHLLWMFCACMLSPVPTVYGVDMKNLPVNTHQLQDLYVVWTSHNLSKRKVIGSDKNQSKLHYPFAED